MTRASDPRASALVVGGILALAALLYLPVLDYPFLTLDDDYGVASNPGIRDLSLRGIRFLFFEDQRDWRWFPFAYLSFAVDHALFGLAPGAVHRTNLLLHLANTALVFALVRTLFRDVRAAAVASLLFAIHPLQVESVAWVSSRKTVLFAFFFLASVLAYVGFVRSAGRARGRAVAWLATSVLLFFCSITSKTTAVTLPAVLLLVDVLLADPIPRNPFAFALRRLPTKLLYVPAIAFAALMTQRLALESPFGADVSFSPLEWAVIVCHDLFFYVAKALLPIRLGVFYPLPNDGVPGLPLHFYVYAVLGLGLVGLCIASYRRRPRIFFVTAWYLVTILPNALLPALAADPPLYAADRYFYQSSVGLFALAGLAASAAWTRTAQRRASGAFAIAAGLAIAGVLLVLAQRQVRAFRGTIPLYEQTLRHHPSDAFYYRLALEYEAADRMSSALQALEQAKTAPNRVFFGDLFVDQMRISNLHRLAGDLPLAAAFLARAIEATPNAIEPADARTPLAYRYLASLWDAAREPARAAAARAAAETAQADPRHYFESHWLVLAPEVALPFLEARVREAPDDAIAWYYLGRGLHLYERPERAAECLRRAEQLGFPPG